MNEFYSDDDLEHVSETYVCGIRIIADPFIPSDMLDCPEGQSCIDGQCVEPGYQLTEEEHRNFDSIEGSTPEEIEVAKKVYAKLRESTSYVDFEVPLTKQSWEYQIGSWSPNGKI